MIASGLCVLIGAGIAHALAVLSRLASFRNVGDIFLHQVAMLGVYVYILKYRK